MAHKNVAMKRADVDRRNITLALPHPRSFKCIHDQVQASTPTSTVPIDYGWNDGKRQTDEWSPIRVKIIEAFNNDPGQQCGSAGESVMGDSYTCDAADVLTTDKLGWLHNTLLPLAREVLEAALQVRPVPDGQLNITQNPCGTGGGVDTTQYAGPWDGYDVVMFVTARPITTAGVLAFASSCQFDGTTRRPTAGQLNYSPASLTVGSELSGQLGTTLHEMSHILGFSNSRFGEFYDPSTQSTYPAQNSTITIVGDGTTTDQPIQYISTPGVLAFLSNHFGCSSSMPPGAELENDGGSGTVGSHWKKRVFQNEYMTGSSSSDPVFSNLTMAYFEDSGWYQTTANYTALASLFDTDLIWGYQQGCSFLLNKCSSAGSAGSGWPPDSVWPGYFCSNSQSTGCAFDMRGQARCGITTYSSLPIQDQYLSDPTEGGLSQLADYCPLYSTVKLCVDDQNTGGTGEYYGANSHCFVDSLTSALSGSSTINTVINQVTQQMGCYESYCAYATNTTDLLMKVVVDGYAYNCPPGKSISVVDLSGSIVCPPAAQVAAVCANQAVDTLYPIIDSVNPVTGKPNDTITINGNNFQQGIDVSVDAECQSITFVSSTQVQCKLAAQSSYKDPLYIGALSAVATKKSITVVNPDKRGAALVGAFQLTVDFNLSAINNFFDLMARNPINTAIVCIALFLGCLCLVYCACAGRRTGGNNARSKRRDYGAYF